MIYLGVQNDNIVLVANSRERLESSLCKFDKIIETQEEYILYNGRYVLKEEAEALKLKEQRELRIKELKNLLAKSDYVVLKIAEGVATREDYENILSDRQSWRDEINKLEAE